MKNDELVTYLSPAAFEAFLEALNNPKPPSQALIDLMRRQPRWDVRHNDSTITEQV